MKLTAEESRIWMHNGKYKYKANARLGNENTTSYGA